MNDTELIEGCKAGKREALETIYRLFSRQMYGVCYRYVGEDSALGVIFLQGLCNRSPDESKADKAGSSGFHYILLPASVT